MVGIPGILAILGKTGPRYFLRVRVCEAEPERLNLLETLLLVPGRFTTFGGRVIFITSLYRARTCDTRGDAAFT